MCDESGSPFCVVVTADIQRYTDINCDLSPYSEWMTFRIAKGVVDFFKDIHPFCDFSKDGMLSIEGFQSVVSCGNEKLGEDMT